MSENCPNCSKKLGIFKTGLLYKLGDKRFCSIKCKGEYNKKNISEIRCKCKECGKVWHYLESEEKNLKSQARNNACIGAGMCCNPFGALFSNKAIDLQREADKFKKCPKCGSINITKKKIEHVIK